MRAGREGRRCNGAEEDGGGGRRPVPLGVDPEKGEEELGGGGVGVTLADEGDENGPVHPSKETEDVAI